MNETLGNQSVPATRNLLHPCHSATSCLIANNHVSSPQLAAITHLASGGPSHPTTLYNPPPSARATTSPTPPAPRTPPPSAKKTPCDSLLFSQFFKHSKRSIVRADSLALSQLIILRAPLNTLSASADIGGMEKISIARRDRSG